MAVRSELSFSFTSTPSLFRREERRASLPSRAAWCIVVKYDTFLPSAPSFILYGGWGVLPASPRPCTTLSPVTLRRSSHTPLSNILHYFTDGLTSPLSLPALDLLYIHASSLAVRVECPPYHFSYYHTQWHGIILHTTIPSGTEFQNMTAGKWPAAFARRTSPDSLCSLHHA